MQNIGVCWSAFSRVSWLQVWKQMHLWPSLPISTCWWWEVTSARGRGKKVLKEQLQFWREKGPRLCISKLRSNEFYSMESCRIGRLDASAGHTMKFSGRNWYDTKIREGKGQSGGIVQKGEPHERHPCASSFEERTPEETSRREDCASKAAWNLARKVYKLKAEDKATFCSPVEKKPPGPVSRNTEDRMFVVNSGASKHMLSKRDLSSDVMDTLRRSRNPITVLTATGENAKYTRKHKFLFMISICS